MSEQEVREIVQQLRFAEVCDLHGHNSVIVGKKLLNDSANALESLLLAQQAREKPEPKRKEIVEFRIPWHIHVGDTVYWVHCSNRVYKGEVKRVDFCEYQGAIYLILYSPTFKINPYPCVHYTHCFVDKNEAHEFAKQLKSADMIQMRCDRCKYEFKENLATEPKGETGK